MVLVHNPLGPIARQQHRLSPRRASLDGVRIGVLGNSKANSKALLTGIAERIAADVGGALTVVIAKQTAGEPADQVMLARLLAEADVVLTGSAD
jgi:hypothetical protein